MIPWYENIPIFSFIFLKGSCSGCKEKISWRYPFVELIAGIFIIYLIPDKKELNDYLTYIIYYISFCILIIHFFIDLKHKILPNRLNLILGVLFILFALMNNYPYQKFILGGLIGFFLPYGFSYIFFLLRKKEGLGGGDIKLWCVLGIMLGPMEIIYNIFYSCFIGSVIGLALILSKRITPQTYIPFGPFIIITFILQVYFSKYMGLINSLLFVV